MVPVSASRPFALLWLAITQDCRAPTSDPSARSTLPMGRGRIPKALGLDSYDWPFGPALLLAVASERQHDPLGRHA